MTHERVLQFLPQGARRERAFSFCAKNAVLAGWTSRDKEIMRLHIEELMEIGLGAPQKTPIFFRCSVSRLTTASAIEVLDEITSGEVEFVILRNSGAIWITVGSDHTDRTLEGNGVTVAKQICDRPICPQVWTYDDVIRHWDRLILRSYRVDGETRTLYQEGDIGQMLNPGELMTLYEEEAGAMLDGTVMFGGTIGAIGGIKPASRFEFELEDPVLKRKLSHGYDIRPLPIRG